MTHGSTKRLPAALLAACLLTGCMAQPDADGARTTPDYTLVAQEDLPPALLEQIEAAKQQDMKLCYAQDGVCYLVRGYGAQPSGSSIRVVELYETDDGLFFDTELIGGGTQEVTSQCPYIVVKLLCDEQNVVFE